MAAPLTRNTKNTKNTKDRTVTPSMEGATMLNRAPTVLDEQTEALVTRVIGCALQVHQTLGRGYLEALYHEAIGIELEVNGIPFKREVFIPIRYRDRLLRGHRLDLVVDGCVVVELKAVHRLEPIRTSQVVSYLKASGLMVGLLMNFNTPVLKSALSRVVL